MVLPPGEGQAIGSGLGQPRPDGGGSPSVPGTQGRRVLIVDDEPTLADILSEHLTERGYATQTAVHGADAIMIASHHPPDVILLDIMMPGIDGVTVLRRMLALNPSVPVIMVTGNGDETVARDALRSGAFDYITKPVDFDRLDEVVSMAVLGPPLAPPSIGSI